MALEQVGLMQRGQNPFLVIQRSAQCSWKMCVQGSCLAGGEASKIGSLAPLAQGDGSAVLQMLHSPSCARAAVLKMLDLG
jgi:hypothetical protein